MVPWTQVQGALSTRMKWVLITASFLSFTELAKARDRENPRPLQAVDIHSILSEKALRLRNARIRIVRNIDRGATRHLDTTVIEVGIDGSVLSVGYRSDVPDQQNIVYVKNGVRVFYLNASLGRSGDIEPLRANTMMTARIQKQSSPESLPYSECFHLDVASHLPEAGVSVDGQGRFRTVARRVDSEVHGIFDRDDRVLRQFGLSTPAWKANWDYDNFTNVAGLIFPQRQVLRGEGKGLGIAESKVHFAYESPLDRQPDMRGFVPPVGVEVIDERFDPPLTYKTIKRGYTDKELVALREARVGQPAGLDSSDSEKTPLSATWVQYLMTTGVIVLLVAGFVRRVRSP